MNKERQALKRKRVVLTLEDKLDVVRLKEKGLTFDLICRQYNIGATTIKDIMKKKRQIEEAVEKQRSLGLEKSKKTLTEAKRPDVEIKLYDWISERLGNNELITNSDILIKAQELSMEIYREEWKASKGWLTKFKRRFNLTGVRLEHEIEDGDDGGGGGDDDDDESASIISDRSADDDDDEQKVEEETIEEHLATVVSPAEEIRLEMTPLDAAEYLLNYVTNNGTFPLKEIITLQMIRDRIAEMES